MLIAGVNRGVEPCLSVCSGQVVTLNSSRVLMGGGSESIQPFNLKFVIIEGCAPKRRLIGRCLRVVKARAPRNSFRDAENPACAGAHSRRRYRRSSPRTKPGVQCRHSG